MFTLVYVANKGWVIGMHRHGNTYTNDKTFAKRFEEDHEDIMIACITAQTDAGKSEVDEDPVYQLVDVEI